MTQVNVKFRDGGSQVTCSRVRLGVRRRVVRAEFAEISAHGLAGWETWSFS